MSEVDQMNPDQYMYSPIHKEFKHTYTGHALDEKSFEMWFGDTSHGCRHDWKATVLLTSTVYDCTKCGVTREEYEDAKKQRLSNK